MRILKQTNSEVHLEFDSVAQFAAVDRLMTPEQTTHQNSKKTGDSRDDWAGCSFDEAVAYATDGWDDGRKDLHRLTETGIQRLDQAPIREVLHDVAGFSPNVPMFCAGMPDCMMTYDEVTKPSVLRLVVEVSRHWRVEPEQVMNYGAALLAYIELIEAEGIRCELWAAHATGGHGKNLTSRVLVKESDQPFDYGALAFALGHAGFQRRLQFRVKEQFAEMWAGCGKTKRGWGGGYGSAVTYPLALFDGDTIFRVPTINDTYTQCDTLDGALRVFEAQIKNVLRSYSEYETTA